MRRLAPTAAVVALAIALVGTARAEVPVIDAAQLTQHAQTASVTVKLVPILGQRREADQGVHCAVTTGMAASIPDPTVQPQAGAGARTIQAYAPGMPAPPDTTARGASLNSQTVFQSTGDVVGGLEASRSTLSVVATGYQAAGREVGTAATVMAAFDMNAAARLRNTLSWNGVIGSANLWLTALNTLNLALASDASRAAIGMRSTAVAPSTMGPACPAGSIGAGTIADPCRSTTSVCSAASTGSACAVGTVIDGSGNVLFVLGPTGPTATAAASQPLSTAEIAAALAALQTSAR